MAFKHTQGRFNYTLKTIMEMITATGLSSSDLEFLRTISPYVKREGPGIYIAVNDDNRERVLSYLKNKQS